MAPVRGKSRFLKRAGRFALVYLGLDLAASCTLGALWIQRSPADLSGRWVDTRMNKQLVMRPNHSAEVGAVSRTPRYSLNWRLEGERLYMHNERRDLAFRWSLNDGGRRLRIVSDDGRVEDFLRAAEPMRE